MIALLSPAKNLDFETEPVTPIVTQPDFQAESAQLIKKLSKLSKKKVSELMHLSDNLASLNYERYQTWALPFDTTNAKQAALAFNGEVYTGLATENFTKQDFEFAQQHLRILSGLHGLLRPLDLIQPYRLEMGTRFSAKPSQKNLYEFWGSKIAQRINTDLVEQGDEVLINLASNEYFKAVDLKKLKARVITCHFKERKGDDYKVVMMYAKKARGMMACYLIRNQVESPEAVKEFTDDNYRFNSALSSENDWVFTRG